MMTYVNDERMEIGSAHDDIRYDSERAVAEGEMSR
jgi:hypothetical protein